MVEPNTVVSLCEYRKARGLPCKHCKREELEALFLNKMRDVDSPPFPKPEGYDEE